jgi:anti-sigma factor RsiW
MTEKGEPPAGSCGEFEFLIMRKLDGEISPADDARLSEHLATCPSCTKALDEFSKLASATSGVRLKEPPPEAFDIYWDRVENRLERGIAWTILWFGLGIVAGYALFTAGWLLVRTTALPAYAKIGIALLFAGLVALFVSVAREKLTMRKTDKYRGVKR